MCDSMSHPLYPVWSFNYRIERVGAYQVQKEIVYKLFPKREY